MAVCGSCVLLGGLVLCFWLYLFQAAVGVRYLTVSVVQSWALRRLRVFFFFFQAEDGIRDLTVTGVQTCALPISCFRLRWHVLLRHRDDLRLIVEAIRVRRRYRHALFVSGLQAGQRLLQAGNDLVDAVHVGERRLAGGAVRDRLVRQCERILHGHSHPVRDLRRLLVSGLTVQPRPAHDQRRRHRRNPYPLHGPLLSSVIYGQLSTASLRFERKNSPRSDKESGKMRVAMKLHPVILPLTTEEQGLRGRARLQAQSRRAREALARSCEASGVRLGPLEKGDRNTPLPFQGTFWSLSHKPRFVAAVVGSAPIGIDIEEITPRTEGLQIGRAHV